MVWENTQQTAAKEEQAKYVVNSQFNCSMRAMEALSLSNGTAPDLYLFFLLGFDHVCYETWIISRVVTRFGQICP